MTTYLDHAATTPVRPEVVEAMVTELGRTGNPSSLHAAGRAARRSLEESREQVADSLGVAAAEVVLVGGGTEADNLAVKGLYWSRSAADPQRRRVLVSAVEHHAVLDPARWLAERQGAEVVELPVDPVGRVDLERLGAELAAHARTTALVSVMWANNEIGTVQPVDEVVTLARRFGVPVHVDAVQAVGRLEVDLGVVPVDAVTVSAHKLGGPVGVGALIARRGLDLAPVLHGGGQERGVRSGTVDVVSARGFAEALTIAVAQREAEAARLAQLRDSLIAGVRRAVPQAVLRGPDPGVGQGGLRGPDPSAGQPGLRGPGPGTVVGGTDVDGLVPSASIVERLPGNVHFTFPGCEGDSLLYLLDRAGICCSTGSACQAGVPQPSHVLLALGATPDEARGALRFSLGWTSTEADVRALLAALPEVVERAQAAGLS